MYFFYRHRRPLRIKTLRDIPIGPLDHVAATLQGGFMRPQKLPIALRQWRNRAIHDAPYGDVSNLPHLPNLPDGRSYYYGGPIQRRFGHMIGEYIHRLWALSRIEPTPVVLFPTWPPQQGATPDIPNAHRQLLDLLGIKDWQIITQPVLVPSLVIAEQGKFLNDAAHQDEKPWLDDIAERNDLWGGSTGKIALSRVGQVKRPLAGEERLEAFLMGQGYRLFRPEAHPVKEQLKTLLNAEKTVMADGSAAHLFDLLPKSKNQVFYYGQERPSAIDLFTIAPKVAKVTSFTDVPASRLTGRLADGSLTQVDVCTADLAAMTEKMHQTGFTDRSLPATTSAERSTNLSGDLTQLFGRDKTHPLITQKVKSGEADKMLDHLHKTLLDPQSQAAYTRKAKRKVKRNRRRRFIKTLAARLGLD